jgi:hypothetical protein
VEIKSSALVRRADECDKNGSQSGAAWVEECPSESGDGDKMLFTI